MDTAKSYYTQYIYVEIDFIIFGKIKGMGHLDIQYNIGFDKIFYFKT